MSIKVFGRSLYVKHCVMADEELELYGVAVSTIAIVVSFVQKKRHKKRRPKFWVSGIFQRRYQRGTTHGLLPELKSDSTNAQYCFKRYMRMDEATYDNLFSLIEPEITGSSRFRQPISAADKFNVTLRYLSTG